MSEITAETWRIQNQHGAETFWHSYFVYRVHTETDPGMGRLLEIRNIAGLICAETGADLSTTIDGLCWLGLQYAFPIKKIADVWKGRHIQAQQLNAGLNLLSVTAYFNLIPLAQKLLLEGHVPFEHNFVFPAPMEVAASAGNADMLQLFQENLLDIDPDPMEEKWLGKVQPCAIFGAALRGDVSILKLAIYPHSRESQDSTLLESQAHETLDRESHLGRWLVRAQASTRSLECHQYLESFFAKPLDGEEMESQLTKHAMWGNVNMVRYLLGRDVPINGFIIDMNRYETPLVMAAQKCQEEVVNLLLERGADPSFQAEVSTRWTALPIAASSGSLKIVRKLLGHGAHANEVVQSGVRLPALFYAVAIEHTAMINMLIGAGASFDDYDGWVGKYALEISEELGMDSMVDMMRNHGHTVEGHSPSAKTRFPVWGKWSLMKNPQRSKGTLL